MGLPLAAPLLGGPVGLHKCESALIASSTPGPSYELAWIADSGASRSLASVRAFAHQGIPADLVYQCAEPTSTINFETGNGTTKSIEQFPVHGSKFGTFNHRILEDCPVGRSLGYGQLQVAICLDAR